MNIRSCIEFPELESSVFNTYNILISEGNAVDLLPEENIQEQGSLFEDYLDFRSGASGTLLSVKDIGHIWIGTSGEIVLDRLPGASKEGSRFFILGTALGIFLLQKGAFPMHGSTVADKEKCLMFVGASGAGKSTMSTYWLDNGYSLITDDVSLVEFSTQNLPVVYPGPAQIKLWEDSLLALKRNPEDLPFLLEGVEKRRLWVPRATAASCSTLTAIIELSPDDCAMPSISMLNGAERFRAIASNIYRGEAISWLGQLANHFAFCSKLAVAVPVFRLTRPATTFALETIFELVEHSIASIKDHESTTPR